MSGSNPPFHRHLIPVRCATPADVRGLAAVMRAAALADVDRIANYEGSATVAEAEDRLDELAPDIIPTGKLRFVRHPDGRVTSVVLTCLEAAGVRQWNLSVSHIDPIAPQRVSDDRARALAAAFLGDGYEEVPPKSAWENVRHFVSTLEPAGGPA